MSFLVYLWFVSLVLSRISVSHHKSSQKQVYKQIKVPNTTYCGTRMSPSPFKLQGCISYLSINLTFQILLSRPHKLDKPNPQVDPPTLFRLEHHSRDLLQPHRTHIHTPNIDTSPFHLPPLNLKVIRMSPILIYRKFVAMYSLLFSIGIQCYPFAIL